MGNDDLLALGAATLGECGARRMAPRIRPIWPGAALAGPAFPLRCTPGDNLAIQAGVVRAPEGSVLVAQVGGVRDVGYWGEVLTTAAEVRSIAGLVIDGAVRDVDALAAHRFPVFATGLALPGATKRGAGATRVPVEVGDVTVDPGDWVVADGDGAVVIPGAAFDEIVTAGRAKLEAERIMFERLRAGATTLELLGLDLSLVDEGE